MFSMTLFGVIFLLSNTQAIAQELQRPDIQIDKNVTSINLLKSNQQTQLLKKTVSKELPTLTQQSDVTQEQLNQKAQAIQQRLKVGERYPLIITNNKN